MSKGSLSLAASIAIAALAPASLLWNTPLHAAERGSASVPAHALGPELRRLDALAGHWSVRQSAWAKPGKPPAVDTGRATFITVLGGRHLRQKLHIASAKPFNGLGYLGYDKVAGKYDSLWMDVNFTGMILAHGRYDPASRTYTFRGAVPDPAHPGTTVPLREVMRVQDANHFSYEYFEHREGKEFLAIRLEYTRID